MNITIPFPPSTNYDAFNSYIRSINFLLSCTGLIFNLILTILLIFIGRRQCATYFLLISMTICDFLYCTVYVSIMLTVDQHINIINHQILCPLSFFLTPFTFTGSTLLLFICLLHFITNYVRRYDTILGQIGGRLSVVFVLAFVIIRSVLGSTSIELMILDPRMPHLKFCTIDMNTPTIVATVQKINHIFAEVTDILVYIGWIVILIIYFITISPCKKSSSSFYRTQGNSTSTVKPLSFASILLLNNNTYLHRRQSAEVMTVELTDISNITNGTTITTTTTTTNKQKHNDVSLIILIISFISIIFYLPNMICKYSTIYFVYRDKGLLTDQQTFFLQISQHTAHLFCLSIRFLPYFIFDKRIRLFINEMMGIKCMRIETRRTLSRTGKYKLKHKYTWHCHCHRRQPISELQSNNEGEEQNHQGDQLIKN